MFQPTQDDLTTNGSRQAALHERAVAVARSCFDGQVFVRVVVEVSNFCWENYHYCGMRRDKVALETEGLQPSPVELVEHLERRAVRRDEAELAG